MAKKTKVLIAATFAAAASLALLSYVKWRLRGEQLTPAVNAALTQAGLKGQVAQIEATLMGAFTVSGVDVILADGTVAKVESAAGNLGMLGLLRGKIHLEHFEAKGIEVDLRQRQVETASTQPATDPVQSLGLGRVTTGPVAMSGRLHLSDVQEIRFNARSEGMDFSDTIELRAGVAWSGRTTLGKTDTDPRAEVVINANLGRTLGDAGITPRALARDLERFDVRITTRDAGPLALGGPSIVMAGTRTGEGLSFSLEIKDAKDTAALEGKGTLFAQPTTALELNAALDLTAANLGILTPAQPALPTSAKGKLTVLVTEDGQWNVSTDLLATWADLGKFSSRIPTGTPAEWSVVAAAKGKAGEAEITQAVLTGPGGVSLRIDQPLIWRGGPLPADSSGSPIRLAAADAPLVTLAPFLSSAGIVPIAGTWSGAVEITFTNGEATVTSSRAVAIAGLTLERDGTPWLSNLNATLPLRAERKGLALEGFEVGMGGRRLAAGSTAIRPTESGGWAAEATLAVDLGDLAGQPGWETLPFEQLRGTVVEFSANMRAAAGQPPVIYAGEGRIRRGEITLLSLKQRAEVDLGAALPIGPLATAKADKLPLEALSALVPGLGLKGTLERADLTLGARSNGSWYIRSESGPIVFAGTSVNWGGTAYLDTCDLTTEIDLSFGERSVLTFEKTDLRSRGRTLATGSAIIPLDGSWPTGEITGELGALATQPFASKLGQVAGGTFRASLTPGPNQQVSTELTLRDVGFRDRVLRINSARVAATLSTDGVNREIEGSFRLGATGETAGTFIVSYEPVGVATRWQGKVNITEVFMDDLLGLAPPETDGAKTSTETLATPDTNPVWAGNVGTFQARVGKAKLGELSAENLEVQVVLEPETARMTSLSGTIVGGTLSGEGTLVFNRTVAGGPYGLNLTTKIVGTDLVQVAKALPGMTGNLEGKIDLRAVAVSTAPQIGRLADNLAAELALDSSGGRVRLPTAMSASADMGGEVAEGLAGLAALGATFGKGRDAERAALAANSLIAIRELQKAATDYRYTKLEVRAQRLADGSLKVAKAEAVGPSLGIQLAGSITALPAASFADWPLRFAASIRGGGKLGESLVALGFDPGTPSADGMRQGPAFDVSGTINDWETNLLAALREGSRPGRRPPSATSPTEGTPTGPARLLPFGR